MTEAKTRPSTAERRLVEDVFDAFQFDPMRDFNIGNRELALGAAAELLRSAFERTDGEIAIILRCSESGVPRFITHVEKVCAASDGIRTLVENIRKSVTLPAPVEPPPEEVVKKAKVASPKKELATKPPKQVVPRLEFLAASVGGHLGVTVFAMQSDGRGFAESNARFIAIACACATLELEPKAVGAYFKRDISLVRFAITRVSTALSRDSGTAFCRDIQRVCATLDIPIQKLIIKR